MKKRIFLLLLCVLTLTVSLCLFTACKNDETPDNGDGTADGGTTDGGTNGGTTETPKISFKTLTVNGTNVSGTVPNATAEFSFLNEVETTGGAQFVVALDESGIQTVAAQSVTLNPGDNTVYVIETVDGQSTVVYTVVIRRKPIYEVTFDTKGGTAVEPQQIEEGYLAEEPSTPSRTGYTFASWDHDFSTPINGSITVNANWNANGDTPYRVEYYRENVDKTDYELIASETENPTGETDTTAHAEQKKFAHFTFNSEMSIMSGNIDGEGTLVLKVYYTRNTYTVSNANTSYGSITGAGTYAYGSTVTVTATTTVLGYEFSGWYSGSECISTETTYTFTVENNVDARFEPKAEMSNFNFTSTATTCIITGIKDKTVTGIIVPDYVTSIGSYAFQDCTSLTSITVAEENTAYKSVDGNLYTKDGKTLIQYAFGKKDTSFTVPDGVTSIGNSAFEDCSSLTSVVIPDSVKTIGSNAFRDCASLTSVKYRGTETQWNAISKESNWNYNTGNYTVTYNYTGQ